MTFSPSVARKIADEIRSAEQAVRALLESVPADQRILITDHDALGYLANVYGYEVAGTVIPSGSTLAEPSSADLVELVEVIEDEGVQVIFANTADPTTLAEAVAAEAGTRRSGCHAFRREPGGAGFRCGGLRVDDADECGVDFRSVERQLGLLDTDSCNTG